MLYEFEIKLHRKFKIDAEFYILLVFSKGFNTFVNHSNSEYMKLFNRNRMRSLFFIIFVAFPFLSVWSQNTKAQKFPDVENNSGKRSSVDPYFIESVWFLPSASPGKVGKFNKAEFGFKLSDGIQKKINAFILKGDTTGINPFDPDLLNFEATFYSPSGVETKRYGFYYQPYLENNSFDRWDSDTTSYPWRVRFAPDEIGKWKVKVMVQSRNNKSPIKLDLTFQCIPSDHKGILKKSATGTDVDRYLYYSETNEPFFAISNNVSSGGFLTYKPSQNNRQMKGVQQLIDVGGNFTRFDMQPQAALPDWPVYNNYNSKLDEMYAFDRMVELCEKNGIYFIIFRHHVELMDSYYNPSGSDWSGVSWFDNPYRIGLTLSKKKEYLTNEEAIEWQKKSLRYVFSRWGYSPNFSFYGYSEINNWYSGILMDEQKIDPKFQEVNAIELFNNWFVDQKKYIQSDLSKNVLFSNSYATIPKEEKSTKFEGLLRNSDVVSIHDYETVKDVNYRIRFDKVNDYWELYKKPIIIEEMGISDNKLRIYCCTGIEYHNSIWATAMMGCFGAGMDWWWDRGVHDFNYHLQLRQVQTFFKGEELSKLNFTPQKWSDSQSSSKRKIENIYLLSENQEHVLGWVHNATFYWRNLEKEHPCIKELIDKSKLTYPCIVGDGYDINNEGAGDYAGARFHDNYTEKGGALEISSTNMEDNPTFKISGLKSSKGREKNWYKIEFYSTNGTTLKLEESATQVLSSSWSSTITPNVPNLDKVNPDYAYKVIYLGKSKAKPAILNQ